MNADALLNLSRNLLSPLSGLAHPDHDLLATFRQASAPVAASLTLERDIDYAGEGNASQMLDLLLPTHRRSDRPLPVIVYIHGGGFVVGDKSTRLTDLTPFVLSGLFAGVTINYRLSDQALWPAQIFDCKAAIRWVRANAKKFNLDADRIGVIGESAGGNLAAMLGVTHRIDALEGDVGPHTNVNSRVHCVVNQFGPTDLLTMPRDAGHGDHSSAVSPAGRLLGGSLESQIDRAILASPITYVSRDVAAFLLVHHRLDPVIPHVQSERMYNALKDAGAEAQLASIDQVDRDHPWSDEMTGRILQFLHQQLLADA